MGYYKPTTLSEKVQKLLQLFALYFRALTSRSQRGQIPASAGLSVLMVVPHLDFTGGLEIQALELSTALTSAGHWVTIVTDRAGRFPHKEFRNGFIIYRLPHRSRSTRVNLLFSVLFFLFRHRKQYGIVHAHGVTGLTLFTIRVARFLGLRTILKGATKGDFNNICGQHDAKHWLYQRWIKCPDRLIAITSELQQEMVSCGIAEPRIRRIPNFVNTSKFTPCSTEYRLKLRERLGISPQEVVFLFLGRLEPRKGGEILLQAWQKISGAVLWIVGSGPAEEEWKKLARELRLQNVQFFGRTLTPLDYYQAVDVFVLPSTREGFANVVLEAMSCGLPCIVTALSGAMEWMRNGEQGLLVSPGSVDELAGAIRSACSDPEARKRWGRNARATVVESFDLARMGSAYISLYRELGT